MKNKDSNKRKEGYYIEQQAIRKVVSTNEAKNAEKMSAKGLENEIK